MGDVASSKLVERMISADAGGGYLWADFRAKPEESLEKSPFEISLRFPPASE